MTDPRLSADLLERLRRDEVTRARLATEGSLFDGYHPDMQIIHDANADWLAGVVSDHGWPTLDQVGTAAVEAAWIIVQHAIGRPAFQRAMLPLLWAEARSGRIPAWQAAMLDDRIAGYEGRPQTWGTQFDWDDQGQMSPLPIQDFRNVDVRRAAVGLEPLDVATARHRVMAARAPSPDDLAARQRAQAEWAVRVGWR